jgi:hypothetical protein
MATQFRLFTQDPDDPIRIGDLVGLLTIVTALALGMSVAFDAGFLGFFGLWLGDIPATLADYTTNALSWLPLLILAYMLIAAANLIILNFSSRSPSLPSEPHPVGRIMFHLALYVLLAAALWVSFGDAGVIWAMSALAVGWQSFAVWMVKHPKIGHEFNALERRVFYYTPWLALTAFGLGWQIASSAERLHFQSAAVQVIGEPSTGWSIVRSYEKGVLTRHERTMRFIRWEMVASIDRPQRARWHGIFSALESRPAPNRPDAPTPASRPQ